MLYHVMSVGTEIIRHCQPSASRIVLHVQIIIKEDTGKVRLKKVGLKDAKSLTHSAKPQTKEMDLQRPSDVCILYLQLLKSGGFH